uniref:Putative transcriptional regulator n=1 Tax=termite gut metagenome TaxID=433724 RepID=S0DE89_9ZZZZ
MQKILIVEDDATIARLVAQELEAWGYRAAQAEAEHFADILSLFRAEAPQLVLLDLSLPHRSGFHWCAEIRKESQVPILFISSAADNMNQVTALHQGADDFIAKPFDLPVLVAKVQAALRRSYTFAATPALPGHRGAVLDAAALALHHPGGRLELTRNESRILQTLLESKGRVVTREAIMRRLWNDESFIDDNTLTVNINRLRKKLDDAGLAGFIATKKGAGYLIPPEE